MPDIINEVKLFEEAHPDIKIKYVNARQGEDEYTKLRTAIKSGSGAPDVVQIEFQFIETFRQLDALVDLSEHGTNDVKDNFVPWTWGQVSEGSSVYYLMRVYAEQSVPDDLLDAARVDGAGELRIFWSVAFRVLVPGFVTVLLLSFVATWNNYFLPLVVLSTPELYPLSVGLVSWNQLATAGGGAQPLFPLVITGALVSVIPIMIAFLFLQRFWQGGLTFGSLKD